MEDETRMAKEELEVDAAVADSWRARLWALILYLSVAAGSTDESPRDPVRKRAATPPGIATAENRSSSTVFFD